MANMFYGKPLTIADTYQPLQATDVANVMLAKERIDNARLSNRLMEMQYSDTMEGQKLRESIGQSVLNLGSAPGISQTQIQPPVNSPTNDPNAIADQETGNIFMSGYKSPELSSVVNGGDMTQLPDTGAPPVYSQMPDTGQPPSYRQVAPGAPVSTPGTPNPDMVQTPYGAVPRNILMQNPKAAAKMLADYQASQHAAEVARAQEGVKWQRETLTKWGQDAMTHGDNEAFQGVIRMGLASNDPTLKATATAMQAAKMQVLGAQKSKITITPTKEKIEELKAQYPEQAWMFENQTPGVPYDLVIEKGKPAEFTLHKDTTNRVSQSQYVTPSGQPLVFDEINGKYLLDGKEYKGPIKKLTDPGTAADRADRADDREEKRRILWEDKFNKTTNSFRERIRKIERDSRDPIQQMSPEERNRLIAEEKSAFDLEMRPFSQDRYGAGALWPGWAKSRGSVLPSDVADIVKADERKSGPAVPSAAKPRTLDTLPAVGSKAPYSEGAKLKDGSGKVLMIVKGGMWSKP